MSPSDSEHQLGDFIKGRLLFIEDYCKKKGLNLERTMNAIKAEAIRLAGTEERKAFVEKKLFGGAILPSAFLPDWLDSVFLNAVTVVLKGPGASLQTKSSRIPCVAFEAGCFNAHRQADSIFKLLFTGKKPEEWIRNVFPSLYRKCYGDEAGKYLKIDEISPHKFRITMDNRSLAKASPIDCSTTIGYLFGSIQKLGVTDPLVTHEQCGAGGGVGSPLCVFDVSWK